MGTDCIAGEMMPKVIICENVKGLTMEYAREHLERMVNDFEALGYTTVFKVLKGQYYGVPQKEKGCLSFQLEMM